MDIFTRYNWFPAFKQWYQLWGSDRRNILFHQTISIDKNRAGTYQHPWYAHGEQVFESKHHHSIPPRVASYDEIPPINRSDDPVFVTLGYFSVHWHCHSATPRLLERHSDTVVDAKTISAISVDNFGLLGKATTGERIATGNETVFDIIYDPMWVKDSGSEQIPELSLGRQHSIALDGKGTVLVWATTNPRSVFPHRRRRAITISSKTHLPGLERRRQLVWGFKGNGATPSDTSAADSEGARPSVPPTSVLGATTSSSTTHTFASSTSSNSTSPSTSSALACQHGPYSNTERYENGNNNGVETHLFWHHAVNVLDPVDVLGHYAFVTPPATVTTNSSNGLSYPERLSRYQHYRNILSYSCAICRINYPHINHGLGLAKRAVRFPTLGIVGTCRDHDRHKTSYCGVCYREATRERDLSRDRVGDGLFRRAYARIEDQEALGMLGSKDIDDEARAAVEGFLTFADGSAIVKKQTRMRQFRSLVAANRYGTREEGLQQLSACWAAIRTHESKEDLDMDTSDFEEEEEEDPEIEQRSLEDHSAKSMPLGDWARNRILDWF
ncbi:hypothetical protein IW261DRAFT_1572713 [Armillaria novae-zelandiae]|uniref:Uncharacterized protein n=1 Tax=Armillaria novae-zelandiae TaxID=153914 RepID=A0AA39NRW6_9AGAR|nr:hypothetical protein IW261DRAFT_1572713 [Armillaria novae-zelandiae]